MTQPCTMIHNDAKVDAEQHPLPYILPPIRVPSSSSLSKAINSSTVELEQLPPQPRSSSCGQMQPPIIRLTGRAGFAVIPPMENFFGKARAIDQNATLCIILDFSTVDTVETCVAKFLGRQASKLARQSPAQFFIIGGLQCGSTVHADLLRGGIECRWHRSDFIAGPWCSPAEATASLSILACERLKKAIRVCRFTNRVRPHISSVGIRTIHALQGSTTNQEQLDSVFRNVVDLLLPHLPGSDLPAHERMDRAGLVIREVSQEEAIACGKYPFQPVFIVLVGQVVVRRLHADPPDSVPQKPIREAALAALKLLFVRLFRRKCRPGETNAAADTCLTPGDKFDGSSHASSCAYTAGVPCWILDIDPGNEAGLVAVAHLATRATEIKL